MRSAHCTNPEDIWSQHKHSHICQAGPLFKRNIFRLGSFHGCWGWSSFLDEERTNQCWSAEWRNKMDPPSESPVSSLTDTHCQSGPHVILLMSVGCIQGSLFLFSLHAVHFCSVWVLLYHLRFAGLWWDTALYLYGFVCLIKCRIF